MLGLAEVAARARIYPGLWKPKQIEPHEEAVIEGDPTERLKEAIAAPERAVARAYVSAMKAMTFSEGAIEDSLAQGAPTRTLEDEIDRAYEAFAVRLNEIEWKLGEAEVERSALAAERAAARKKVLFDSEPTKTELRTAYQARNRTLIKNLTAIQRRNIYALLQRSAVGGVPVREVARQIREILGQVRGLTVQEESALFHYRQSLIAKKVPTSRVMSLANREYNRLLRARSMRIARTEMAWAQNTAQLTTMTRASQQLNLKLEKEWFTAKDEVTCPICAGLAGRRVSLMETYPGPGATRISTPPAHPHCRCAIIYVTERPKPTGAPPPSGAPTLAPPVTAPIPSPGAAPATQMPYWCERLGGTEFGTLSAKALRELELCGTTNALADWLRVNLGIPVVEVRGEVSACRDFVRGLAEAHARLWQTRGSPLASVGTQPGTAYGAASRYGKYVHMGTDWTRDRKAFLDALADDMRGGWFPKNDGDIEDVAIHEVGHHLHYAAFGATNEFKMISRPTLDALDQWVNKYYREAIRGQLDFSEVAASKNPYLLHNEREFAAEHIEFYFKCRPGTTFQSKYLQELDEVMRAIGREARIAAQGGTP